MLEAGGAAPPFLDIPLIAPMIQKTPYDWQYVTIPQKHACKALINNVSTFAFCEKKIQYILYLLHRFLLQQSRWPRGKILGGTSRLNYMAYVLGHWMDYEKWFPDFTGT